MAGDSGLLQTLRSSLNHDRIEQKIYQEDLGVQKFSHGFSYSCSASFTHSNAENGALCSRQRIETLEAGDRESLMALHYCRYRWLAEDPFLCKKCRQKTNGHKYVKKKEHADMK